MNAQGLHARPASIFVQIASKYDAQITVRKGGESVNGKSIVGILMLGAEHKSQIEIQIQGSDAVEAMAELEDFLGKEE